MVVLGFHPVRSGMKYQLTTPLLFANIIRWMAPDAFPLLGADGGHRRNRGRRTGIGNRSQSRFAFKPKMASRCRSPWKAKILRFFTGAPGIVRVLTGDRELVYSLTLPQPGDTVWKPSNVKRGLPGSRARRASFSRHLAMAGARGSGWLARRLDSLWPHRSPHPRRQRRRRRGWFHGGGKHHDLRARLGAGLSAPAARLGCVRVAADAARHRPGSEDAVAFSPSSWRWPSPR